MRSIPSPDRRAQAAHSLREILRELISLWVSNEEIMRGRVTFEGRMPSEEEYHG